ncbi:hypothetical protein J4211_01145 [Candidatus Woesearchaeota archaeon]|nr:hypothetical protein [Candidatus Woesearchaeota archaeon]
MSKDITEKLQALVKFLEKETTEAERRRASYENANRGWQRCGAFDEASFNLMKECLGSRNAYIQTRQELYKLFPELKPKEE